MRSSHCRECRKPEKALGAARRRGAGVKPLPRRLIVILWQRQAGRCCICQRPMIWGEFEVEHKVPIARGGKHELPNLGLAHGICNRAKGAK
jgi:5-methylcytosine-specific restriction endonuclease McrA